MLGVGTRIIAMGLGRQIFELMEENTRHEDEAVQEQAGSWDDDQWCVRYGEVSG